MKKATATFYPNEDGGEVVIRLDPRNAAILREVIACGNDSITDDLVLGGDFFRELNQAVPEKYQGMYNAYCNYQDNGDTPDFTVFVNDDEYVSPEAEEESEST